MAGYPKIISTIIIVFAFIACQKTYNDNALLLEKVEKFREYDYLLDKCKSSNLDSIKNCIESQLSTINLQKYDKLVWEEYGLAKLLFQNGHDPEALEMINNILPNTKETDLVYERAELLNLRGDIYKANKKLLLAGEDKYQAAIIFSQIQLYSKAAKTYHGIANLHYSIGNYLLTVENGQLSMNYILARELPSKEDSMQLMHISNTLGLGYYKLNRLDSATKYFNMSHRYAENLNEEFWSGLVLGNLANIYLEQGMLDQALINYENDIKVSLKYEEFNSATFSLLQIAQLFISRDDLSNGKYYCDSAMVLIKKSNPVMAYSKYYSLMSQIFEQNHQNDSALFYYKKHMQIRDSVQNLTVNAQLQQIQNDKQFERQLVDLSLLKAENDLSRKNMVISNISIIAILVIVTLLVGLLLIIKKNNRQLRELNMSLENKVLARTSKLRSINKELDTYLYRVSHDVRRPILTILGLLQVAEMTDDQERGTIRIAIKKTATDMEGMLRKLQMAHVIQKQEKKYRSPINVKTIVSEYAAQLMESHPDANIDVFGDDHLTIESNIHLVEIILRNILENACIFSNKKPNNVDVSISQKEEDVIISIKDQGIGLTQLQIEEMYDPYVRFSNLSNGSGIGLHLAMRSARKLGAKIKVKSVSREGTEFIVSIPRKVSWNKL